MRRLVPIAGLCGLLLGATPASADFPFAPQGNPDDYTNLYVTGEEPDDVGTDAAPAENGDGEYWKYSASPEPPFSGFPLGLNAINDAKPAELGGVRGASLFDFDEGLDWAWQVSSGRPDVTIAVLDSGIQWNSGGAMNDLRFKTRINQGEAPVPLTDRTDAQALVPGTDCDAYTDVRDANDDGVFNLRDYACDSRVNVTDPRRVGPAGTLTPQDALIAFSDGDDDDGNGFVDDMVGWDFLDDDNDPFDDVQYGHGTGEAEGSNAEADNGSTIGSCPNCTVIHMRVGNSFIADVNRFAAAVIYATDNGALIVQSALGTLNNSSLARDAVEYAYKHGVTSIVSAADEAAQHNNQPYLPKTILVNSVTRRNLDDGAPEGDQSYLAFNGCTNFNAKITLAIPSTSCSSDAVGVGSGLAGVLISAALNAHEEGALDAHPSCVRAIDGPDAGTALDPCVISPNEVRQLMASGTVAGAPMPDDVNFASPAGGAEASCAVPFPDPPGGEPSLLCTHPFGLHSSLQFEVDANRPVQPLGSTPALRSYPARAGHDQFYGYGRVNINRSIRNVLDDPTPAPSFESRIPPEAEIESPNWNQQLDPAQASFDVTGHVAARTGQFTCQVYVAPGHYPNNELAPTGDFTPVAAAGGGACDGTTPHTGAIDGKLAGVDVATLQGLFPPATDFTGPEPVAANANGNGRPNSETRGFVVKVVVSTPAGGGLPAMTGEDQRAAYLLRDQDLLPEFPRAIRRGGAHPKYGIPTGDVESSPAFADLDGDNDNELVFAGSDGFVHAIRPDGSELPGWPVRGDVPSFISGHAGTRAFATGEVSMNLGGAMLSSVAIADADHDGVPEVYVADLEGKVYGWSATGNRIFTEETRIAFSGKPLNPFENVRYVPSEPRASHFRRTMHGFLSSPVLADLDRNDNGRLELIGAAMDRHVYAWETSDSTPGAPGGAQQVPGYPVLVVDPVMVDETDPVDPQTHAVSFDPERIGVNGDGDLNDLDQGGIVDTPAVGDIDDDDADGPNEAPEIIVGTNEQYVEPMNAGTLTNATLGPLGQSGLLQPGNTRLYALEATGDFDGDPLLDSTTLRDGWPFKLGIVLTGLLPVVGEGVTGNPIIGPVDCPQGNDTGPNVGALANNGPAYIINPDASSCYGESNGAANALPSETGAGTVQGDRPVLPAVGHPAFGAQADGLNFFVPAAGIVRALDLVFPEYQPTGQDFVAGWNTTLGQFRPGFPATVNDLQFLTGPSIADLDGLPGEEIVEGTASKDLVAFNPAGLPVDPTRWPKATTDWTVANALIGSFGTVDTEADATKVVVSATRSGYLSAYATDAPACSPSSWPRFHHDNANSGDFSRDAVLPGRPFEASISGSNLGFNAPGDDLLCGTADHYELATSANPIDATNFASASPLIGAPAPGDPGDAQTYALPGGTQRYVAVRAVDEQGNVGRPAVVDRGAGAGGSGGSGGSGGGGGGYGEGYYQDCTNVITGTAKKDSLRGTSGEDRIRGRGGDDRIKGRGGDDCVSGQGGKDRLSGGSGEDLVKGGRGKDRLSGGSGDDVIRARRGARDQINCGAGDDVVFASRKRDRIAKNCEQVRGRP